MAKIQIKSEKLTPFGGIFSIMEKFDSMLSPVIDSTLGQRCSSIFGYQFSEIVRSLMSVYFCGGSCVEDVTSQLMRHLSYHPTLRTCSSDTILRAIKELTQENISYTSDFLFGARLFFYCQVLMLLSPAIHRGYTWLSWNAFNWPWPQKSTWR